MDKILFLEETDFKTMVRPGKTQTIMFMADDEVEQYKFEDKVIKS